MNVGKRVEVAARRRVKLERLPTMRKTSYAVTFILVLVSVTFVSPYSSLYVVSITITTRFKNILAVQRTDW